MFLFGFGLMIVLALAGQLVFAFLFFVTAAISGMFFVPRFTARANTEWKIDETEIRIKWLSQFIFHNKPDISIHWDDIQEYKYQPDNNFDLFKLTLKDGTKIKLWHHTDVLNDDFQAFLRYFTTRVETHNSSDTDITNDINRSKTIYENNWGLALAVFAGAYLISMPFLIALMPNKSKTYQLLIPAGGALFFISQVIIHRRKKRTKQL